jgi:hypothetical protein
MDLEALFGYVFTLGLPVWLVVEQLLHSFKTQSAVPRPASPARAETPLRRAA